MPKRITIAPAITRVHKLFRIRTIVNESAKYIKKREQGVNTKQIGRILVDRKLSKTSILSSPNKLKRARDHALNASILGFFVPIPHGHGFVYAKTPIADLLCPYDFDQSCPYDLHENAIFVDRLMKLKLGNAYDSRHTYSSFHTRPLLSVLTVLAHQKLHIAQIHYLLSQKNDLAINPSLSRKILKTFAKYPSYNEESVKRFIDDFGLGDKLVLKEMGRSTKPLLDWAQQGGLLTLGKDNWCIITENGLEAQKYYSKYSPIWYDLLPFNATLSAALLILFAYGLMKNLRVDRKKLEPNAMDALRDLQSRFSVWNSSFSFLDKPIDFDLNYDVPYNLREEVGIHLSDLAKDLQWKRLDINEISTCTVSEIEKILKGTPHEREQMRLKEALGIDLPRRECFQTDFEWEVCVRLRVLQFPANPYQGEFEGETNLPMANENPDIIIKNTVRVLIECKSRNEWGDIVKYDKRVGGELCMYQSYAEDVKANSAVFICDIDRFDLSTFVNPFIKQDQKLSKICLVCWNFLDKAQKDVKLFHSLELAMMNPKKFTPQQRIFC
jgi:hypothetical protein